MPQHNKLTINNIQKQHQQSIYDISLFFEMTAVAYNASRSTVNFFRLEDETARCYEILLRTKHDGPGWPFPSEWMYTTNTIENLNRGICKYIKTKVQFVDDAAAQKAVYLVIMNMEKKWSTPLHNWGLVLHQFLTIFENRCKL